MTAETIEISTPDGVAEAYVSRPDTTGDHPPVLLYIDAFGLRPRIEEMADRIAGWGFVVMAPNVFYRDGTAAEVAPTADLRVAENREAYVPTAMARVKAHTPDQAAADREAYLDALLGLPGVRGPVGVTGYCMGGRLALRAAAGRPDDVAAVGIFHAGGLVTDAEDSPHRLLASVRAEVVAGHADHDRSNPPEAIAAFDAALDAAGLTYATAVYPRAAHGFTMSDTSSYDEAATERHFTELQALFGRVLA
ncbi:dienelactone hydrolase family protein [Aeromicrobium terrae]|uniref:Dienelactone hydrolase family protein n=1 Tax=Aeromicrobium terrae TaxID=2498846 RepID=A0A5C8NHB9_9ACTN|nr:dienelactone hydrolase family protein [Aeromicrobium terrae]TXL60678.1 dienelactone hydrolase family protein [Aeromicrobium terrae]